METRSIKWIIQGNFEQNIKVNGLDQLNAKLKKNMDLNVVKTIVKKNGADLQKKAQHYVPVDTGTLKRSIGLNIKDGGLTAVVAPTTDYAEYVEYGTRFMESQPYMRPALGEQKQIFKSDLEKVMK